MKQHPDEFAPAPPSASDPRRGVFDPGTRGPALHGSRSTPSVGAHALKLVRRGCLVVPLGGDRPLARACVELLRSELPSLRPTLDADPGTVDVVWACGYRPGAEGELERLRALHPAAELVVTGRGVGPHVRRLLAAGADRVLSWPASIGELRDALRAPRVRA